MRYLLTFEMKATWPPIDGQVVRDIGIQLDRLTEARPVHAMGIFGDARGGFVDVEFARAEDLYAMLDGPLLDCAEVQVRPVLDAERPSDAVVATAFEFV